MTFAQSARPLARTLAACCVATWSAAAAQTPAVSERVEFAGADICRPDPIPVPTTLKTAPQGNYDAPPIHIEADSIETEGDHTVILRGSAEVVQGRRGLYAERIVYHRDTYRANAEGDVVFYTAGGDEIRAEALDVAVDTFTGKGTGIDIRIADDDPFDREDDDRDFPGGTVFAPFDGPVGPAAGRRPSDGNTYARARATAQSVAFAGDFQRLDHVTMTTCAEGNADVLLRAREIELDHAAGTGTAKSMTVKFKQLPIFYFPSATFPINDERKTGFLFPAVGYDNESGALVEAPYYINIAPQYDATVTPRLLSDRGAQLFGQFRYLGANGRGALRGEFLPSDDEFQDRDRYAIGYDHRHRFGDDWRAAVDWQVISDSAYLRDFANEVDIVASSYVPQRARLDYFGEALRFSARVAAYDSANDAIARTDRPYEILPQLQLQLKPRKLGLLRGGMEAHYGNFRHQDDARVSGTRLRLKPHISIPLERDYGRIVPRASLQAIRYQLDDNAPAADNTPSENIPVFSIDGRLFFDRQLEFGGAAYSQTLEPRLFYVNIPKKRGQIEFPNFDTSVGSYSSFAHFFRENRFFGGDRVGDTEQLAVGVTSRITDNRTGRQRLKLSLGRIFYFEDREIGLSPDAETETENASGFLGEVTAAVSAHWAVTGFARWRDEGNGLGAFRLSADYYRDRRRNASAAYTFGDDRLEQINVAFHAPLGPRWQLRGEGAYSLEEDTVQSSGIGLSYDGCCWAVRAAIRRYLDGEGNHKNRFVFTLELDDLGRIRSRL